MRSFQGRDILSLKDVERDEYFQMFAVAEELRPYAEKRRNGDLLRHKTLLTAFYQPSTRTRLSTEAAMHRLGGHVLGFSDAKMTRAGDFYQESMKDTVKMLEFYGDVIAMRHHVQGAPHEAAQWASVPVINCGDGWGEHPTQVLTDLYTDPELVAVSPYLPTLKESELTAVPRPRTPNYNAVSLAIQKNSYAALQGDVSVDEAITKMAADLEQAIK